VVLRNPDREVTAHSSVVAAVVVAPNLYPWFLSAAVLATKPKEERWAGNTRSVSHRLPLSQHERYGKHHHDTLSLPQ
jgi:hypothetical protein